MANREASFSKKQEISFTLNQEIFNLEISPDERLLDLIRDRLGLTGTKEGCGAGECGACTVIMNGQAVNSCIVPAARAHNAEILTVEGLSKGLESELHPLQKAFLENGAVQCGYCTPGMLMSAKAFLDRKQGEDISRADIKEGISGNLCRCTGYQKIIDAVYAYAHGNPSTESIEQKKG